ncbi:MAG: hypothetical protein AAGF71_14325 [Pseudomonadota bacterium]
MTQRHVLTTNWMEVGTGPVILQPAGRVRVHFGAAPPTGAGDDAGAVHLMTDETPFSYEGDQKVWAKGDTGGESCVVSALIGGTELAAAQSIGVVWQDDPSISPSSGPAGTVFSLYVGRASGKPSPTLAGVLTLDGQDVTAQIVNNAYISDTAGELEWQVTASNGVSSQARTASVTVTASDSAGGGSGQAQANSHTATVQEFGLADNVFDVGAAFGRVAAIVPVSGSTTANVGDIVQVRAWSATAGATTPWMDVEVTMPGVWATDLSVVHVAGSPWRHTESRVSGSSEPEQRSTTRFATGHVLGILGQSEIDRTFITGGGGYTGALANPDQVQIVVGDPTFAGSGQPGNDVTDYTITRGFAGDPGLAPKWQHAADMIQKATGDKVMIVDLALSASGLFQLTDDATDRRRWSDFEAMLDAAGWQDGVRPGVLVHMWAATDSAFFANYLNMFRSAFTGYDAGGGVYALGTQYGLTDFASGNVTTHQHDHLLFDLTGQGRGKFDPAETKVALCLHRFLLLSQSHASTPSAPWTLPGRCFAPSDRPGRRSAHGYVVQASSASWSVFKRDDVWHAVDLGQCSALCQSRKRAGFFCF